MSIPLLDAADGVLLDFDGPVCSLFAGYPATRIADLLTALITEAGRDPAPRPAGATDPLAVLRAAAGFHPDLVPALDDALTRAEVHAARTARPTPGASEFLRQSRLLGRPVVIVSNNSADGVRTYLEAHRLGSLVTAVVGRPRHHPEAMKPRPDLVVRALAHLGLTPERVVLIGDSTTDIEVAVCCRVPSIGYANRPAKLRTLAEAGAGAIVRSMADLLRAPAAT